MVRVHNAMPACSATPASRLDTRRGNDEIGGEALTGDNDAKSILAPSPLSA
jgi:hypothetical protein